MEETLISKKDDYKSKCHRGIAWVPILVAILIIIVVAVILCFVFKSCSGGKQCPQEFFENAPFANKTVKGRAFFAVEEGDTSFGQSTGLHVTIGYLGPGESTDKTLWIGSRNGGLKVNDYPSKNALFSICTFELDSDAKRFRDYMYRLQNGLIEWKYTVEAGKGQREGNCAQLAYKVLRETGLMPEEVGDDILAEACKSPKQFQGLFDSNYIVPVPAAIEKEYMTMRTQGKPALGWNLYLDRWKANTIYWDCMRTKK